MDAFELPATLAQSLQRRAAQTPDKLALRFLSDEKDQGLVLTYRDLDLRARTIAAALQSQAALGDRAILLFPSGPDYVAAFFGCLYAGVIAVPAYPPESNRRHHQERLLSIIADAEPSLVLTASALRESLLEVAELAADGAPALLCVDTLDSARADAWQAPELTGEHIAFLQYTSGSTALPKGVQVSHGNLVANEKLIRHGFGIDLNPDDVIVSWLPLYHDMGLIGGLLQPIFSGVPCVLMAPAYFLSRPLRWLEAISDYKGTISGGPDFAYQLCAARVSDSALARLDLSGWRVAYSGSEPIRLDSLDAFAEKFAGCGFDASSFFASYGLAEATLFVAGGKRGQGIPHLRLDEQALARNTAEPGQGSPVMSCGTSQPEHGVLIADPQSLAELGENQVGEVWACGPSIAHGYWRNPEATAKTFVQHAGQTWLRTGDLGFIRDGELYITGRLKDMLIVRGQNIYPQDIEQTIEREVDVVRKSRIAAFAVTQDGVEGIGIAAEIGRSVQKSVPADELIKRLRHAVADAFQQAPSVVVLLNPGALPKTSSGKLQRSACRTRLADGSLDSYAVFPQQAGAAKASDALLAPSNLQELVARTWREHLQIEDVAAADHFFLLGGNSIVATQVVASLREALGIELNLRLLFEAPTLEGFVAAIEGVQSGAQVQDGIVRLAGDEGLPQSLAQNRLWFTWQLDPHSSAYNIPAGLNLRGELDEDALRTAFQRLVERHESLRTRFYEEDGVALQRIDAASPLAISRIDLSELDDDERRARALAIREEQARLPFDLENGPLLRVQLVCLDEQEHQLLVTLHHIIADGWSLNVLIDEFSRLYAATVQDQPLALEPLPVRYADYGQWQREWLARGEAQRQLDYWKAQLGDEQPSLNLATDHPRSARQQHSAARYSLRLSAELSSAVKAAAQHNQSTPFMLLLAGFQSLLHRYSGQTDIRVGVPGANRPRLETQGLIGFFINTLVLRAELEVRLPFAQLLARTRQTALEAQANQDLPFDQLVEAFPQAREQGLFQVMFNHQQRDLSALRRLPGLLADELPWHSREAKFDLQLHSEEDRNGRISLSFDYADELFERATIVRLAAHYVRLLTQVSTDADIALGDLQLLDAAEVARQQDWSVAPCAPASRWLPELLNEQALRSPERTALVWDGGSLDFAGLHVQANRLANYLRDKGVGPDVKVAIAVERSPQLLVGLLAIIKAGGAYVPLDPDYPSERLAYMLADSGVSLLLTQSHLLGDLPSAEGVSAIALDTLKLDNWPSHAPGLHVHGDNLAYVIYTSGSTGQPKGVGNTHAALAERLQWMQATYQLNETDVLMQKAPISFDVSVWECFWPLITGCKLVIAGPGEHRDPHRIAQLVREHGVTTLHFVPPLLQLFIDEPLTAGCDSLRRVFSGGEALPAELRNRVLAQLPNAQLHNRYGPTETAINVTHWHCQTHDGARSPIGRPLGNVICRVLDGELNAQPDGVAGELCIGGIGLARGYLGRAGLTAERFVPDAAGEPGARLYRTGDRVRWAADGALEYFGRLDHQVKLRGFRVEPQEIEARLLALAGVGQAAVLVRETVAGPQLVGYFTAEASEEGEAAQVARLKAELALELPEYMVPAQLMRLDVMPLGPSGKLDRRALPEPQWQSREHIEPQTELEQRIAAIWRDVLGVPRIGLADDFFELGGHSLLATQIISRVRQSCDVELPLRVLFEHRELGDFAARVAALHAAGERNSQQPIGQVDRRQAVPLSYSQQRMWFLWQMEPDSPAYNVGGMARLSGAFDIGCFEAALQALILRHETLRTTFPSVNGVACQKVSEETGVAMQWLDLSALPAAEREVRLHAFADSEAHTPFDLETGPLLRACLVKAGEQEHYFVLTLHHIVTEGWAMDIFARELGLLYEAFLDGKPSPLEPLAVQYLDYSVWQRQWLESGERQRQLDYWTAQLGKEHPLLELPGDRPRPAVQSHQGELFRFDLADDLAGRVRAFNAKNGLTLFMTMTAALAVLLYRYSGQTDLRIGAPVANRIRPESEGLIGAFLNTQVLRVQLDGQMSVGELFEQVRHTVIEGQSHQDLPFDHLVEALQPPRSAAWNPLFQVMCNVQRWEFQQSRELAGMTVEYLVNDARATKFDLNLEVTELDHRLGCCLTYSTDLFDEPRIARMAGHWRNLLQALLDNPQQRLGELPLLDDSERQGLLDSLGAEPGEQRLDQCIHSLFSQRVRANPEAGALTFRGQTLSYGELDAQVNRLAWMLRERGVGPQVRVGLALERSLEMVIGLLAILKAGGAYVPLDPEYPLERLQYMIKDSGVRLLLSDATLLDALGELPEGVARWSLEEDLAKLAGYPDSEPPFISLPQHQAYLIYTSGSTGLPKGVVVSHGEIAMHCQAVIKRFDMRPDDCELHFYSINFDAATERLLVPLLTGSRLVLRAQGQWDAEEICTLIREQGVTILGFTPSYGGQLAQWLATQQQRLPVRMCITGGEALTGEHLQRIRAAFAPALFFNAYGPTETVVMPLACLSPAELDEGQASVPIGSVVGARVAYILDTDLALVPQGATGELYVGGAGLAVGYHERAGLTAERFVADPFATDGGRLYRTGDLVRQRADGQVEYIGRVDHQVKIRGFRIELGEIETRLLDHPAIREAVVLALETPAGKQLAGYLVSDVAHQDEAQQAHLREALKTALKAQLPDYMVPTHLILLDAMPLTANGKLDRRALPAPDPELNRQHYVAPSSELELTLARIWGEVLNVAQVGLNDNFFELGGDSILSIQVVSRARAAGIHFSPRDLFQHQTVQSLAAVATTQELVSAEQGLLSGTSGLTPIQHWFFETPIANRQHWNQAVLLEPTLTLHAALLEQALNAVQHQHDALRLRFSERDGQWQAQFSENAGDSLLRVAQVTDMAQCADLFDDAQRSLDLAHGPLLRALLVDGPQGQQRLLLAIHHLVVDGVSWRVLLEDLQTAYRQLQVGEAVQLPAKTSAMRDWAARLHTYAASESLREERDWWQGQLAGGAMPLPDTNLDGGQQNLHASTVSVRLDAQRTRQLLQDAPAAYRTQINDLLLTALARVLCQWTGQASALVQLEGHGRETLFDEIDLTRSVGWFTSAYPLRLTPVANDAAASIKAIKEQLRQVPHKGLGYGVLRYLGDDVSRAAMQALPLAPVTFNYLGQFDQSFASDALFRPLEESAGTAHDPHAPLPNELSIDAQVYAGELVLRWTFSGERHQVATIDNLATAYLAQLQALVEHCVTEGNGGLTPSDFPLASLTQAQLDALPVPAARIEDVYPLTPMQEGMLLHTLLEPGTGLYYMQDRYRINSDLDPERFAHAWQAVVARHEALRASFCWDVGQTMLQVIHKPGDTAVEYLDWREVPADEQEPRLQALHKREREAGFDLLRQAPFHLRLIRVGEANYWFMMSNHHILIDAWCRSLLMNDFFDIYMALGEGRDAQLSPPPRYRDYIGWLQQRGLEQARTWWRDNLRGFERPTPIPSDRPYLREHASEHGGMIVGDVYTRLEVKDGARLRELAQQHQLTVNTFAQAAWALTLRRMSGDRDVLFGVTVAGRPVDMPQMQRTVGLFINTIALRVGLPRDGQRQSVRQWLSGLLDSNMELREYEYLPLVNIQENSELPKGMPLFDSLFVFENAPVEVSVLDRAQSLNATSDSGRTHTNYPLTAVCYPGDDLGLHLSYDQRYFDESTVNGMLAEFKRLLLALVEGFHGDMAELPLLGEAEREFLVNGCNQSAHDYPLERSYVALFEEQVAAHPERIAVSCLERQDTYAELNAAANRLGHALIVAGAGFDQPIALLAERGSDLLGMIVGSFKAGAGYLPLDPALPNQRLSGVIAQSGAPVLVCSAACEAQARELLAGLDSPVQLLVWEQVQQNTAAVDNPGRYSAPDNLAYVIFTSGSTGLPKGVMVEQRGMLNNQLSKVPYLDLSDADVIAQTASQSFDISVWQFLAAPLFGARVDIVPNDIARDPQALLAHVQAQGISVLESVPSLIQGLLAEERVSLDGLRWMLPTGEAMPPELAKQWLLRYPQIGLVNAYGPAECSDDVAFFRVDLDSTQSTYLPIGTPTDNNLIYLLDDALELVPLGAVGELCVAGTGVGRGYVADPRRTTPVYVPNPFGAPGERLYRTGDLARRRADGVLEYVGRADHQVKIRGYRIELGEIETRLQEHPAIREAVVLDIDGPQGKQLAAYVTTKVASDAEALREELKTALKASLPDYMVPTHFVLLAAMPLTPNGKLDRKALPQPDTTLSQTAYVAPVSELEQQLAAIWAEVLKIERVGLDDSFFELGGHSLLATQVISRVRQALKIELSLRSLFEAKDLRGFARQVEHGESSKLQAIGKADRGQPLALSYAQQRQWFLWQLEPQSAAYNMPAALRLKGALDIAALELAFEILIGRHETLRTTFRQDGSQAVQVIHGVAPFVLALEQLPDSPLPRDEQVRLFIEDETLRPFDLEQGPLLRVRLLHLGENEHVLVLVQHHIVTDGWSMPIMVDELMRLYAGYSQGEDVALAPLPIQYADYALWQRTWMDAGEKDRQLAYWTAQLGGEQPVLELPTDHPRPPVQSTEGAQLHLELDAELAARLKGLAQAQGVTLFMLLLASLQTLLHRYSGLGDVRVGVPIANRNRAETEGLIGFFVNTQVLKAEVDSQTTVAALLQQVKRHALQAQAHQDLPFEQLVEALQPQRDLSRSPLFQVMYNHQNEAPQLVRELAGLTLQGVASEKHTAQFDLMLNTVEQDNGLSASLTYATALFEADTIARMAEHWQNLLRGMVADAQQRIGELPLLGDAEQQHILRDWNATAAGFPSEACIQSLIEAQVAATPDAPALVFAGEELSYAEVNRSANQLAHKLRELGVGPDALVGISVERSLEMVIGLVAIIKAGGAYVPLDPDYPQDRLAYMIEDSGVQLLLTQKALVDRLPIPADIQSLCLDQLDLNGYSDANPSRHSVPENLAYVIYTSGSTGKPKGAGNSHRALVNRLHWMQKAYGLDGTDTVLQKTPFSFDVSVWEFFWPLLTGARLAVALPGDHRDPERLVATINEYGVSTLHFVPSMLQAFMTSELVESCASLKRVVCSGEALPAELAAQVLKRLPHTGLYNLYGPTEAAIDVTHWTCTVNDHLSVPIGQPIDNLKTHILEDGLLPAAPGTAAELYLGGVGLARGYHNRPSLTAERFVPDPFSTEGGRLYRTGDLARYRDEGVIEYAGRIDHQVKIRGLRIELGEIEARLLEYPAVREASVIDIDGPSGKQLAAYLVAQDSGELKDALKAHLKAHLPEFMVPSHFVLLEKMPLSANGKLDRRALPKPDISQSQAAYVAPANALETQLAAIWADVLKLEKVGVTDNFFELGGDSIISIQVVSRARQAGIVFSPKDLFQRQTVQGIAQVASRAAVVRIEQGPVTGETPLMPIQHWFFDSPIPERHHWNQSVLLKPTVHLEAAPLEAALQALLVHHDALRLSFVEGRARFRDAAAGELLWVRELSSRDQLAELTNQAQRSLDLQNGPLLRALLVNLPQGEQRLLLVIHHLAVDGVSWRILLEDLQAAYNGAALPAKTHSVKVWAEHLRTFAGSPALEQELGWWQAQLQGVSDALPLDRADGGRQHKHEATVRTNLNSALTRQLLQDAPAAYRTQINDLLLTALARVISRWSGNAETLVRLEGHGREDLFEGLDTTRTVGWFTSLYPVKLTPALELGASIKAVKEQLRAVPNKGLGYGVLRYLGSDAAQASLAALPQGEIVFNYLGQLDASFAAEDALFAPSGEGSGEGQSPEAPLGSLLAINGQVLNGALELAWSFSNEVFDVQTVQALADAYGQELQHLIEHCVAAGVAGVTPSDFPLAGLDQPQLDSLPLAAAQIADIYPLSPMQQGMLFHSLYEQEGGSYINQMLAQVRGLDVQRFRAAWQAVVDNHDVLRANFISGFAQPLQVIRRQVAVSFAELDVRGQTLSDEALAAWAEADKQRGFDLQRDPLLRLTLLRTAEDSHYLVFTSHHILLDGWSNSRMLGEVLQRYSGHVPPTGKRYRDYIEWLQRQDAKVGQDFWLGQLAELDEPTRLVPVFKAPVEGEGFADLLLTLDSTRTRRLNDFARDQRVTANTLLQAAWMLVLQRYTGQSGVTFGATVAGRPADLSGVEEQLGLFINTLPVVGRPRVEQTVAEWVQQVQAQNLALREHEHTPLYDIQRWAGWNGEALFDSIMVFENYPIADALHGAAPDALVFDKVVSQEQTHYPLTLVIEAGDELAVRMSYDRQQLAGDTVAQLAAHFEHLLLALVANPQAALGELSMLSAVEQQHILGDWNATAAEFPSEACIQSLIEAQVAATPDAPALVFAGEELSYAEVNRRANQLAHKLRELGVGPDALVGISVERSLEMVIGLVAIIKAGGAYVPLDPDYPQDRLAYMIEDSGVQLLLTQKALVDRLPIPTGIQSLCLDQLDLNGYSDANPSLHSVPENLAYVIYTSGSTGKPKGAGNSHRALVNRLHWMQKAYGLDGTDTVLQKTPFSFDVSVWEFFWPLLTGARLAVALPGDHRDPERLVATINEYGVSTLHFVPSMLQAFMTSEHVESCASLKRVVCSGEALPAELAAQVLKRLPHSGLYNLYGPTEAAIDVTHWTCTVNDHLSVPIGQPIDNLKTHILEDGLLPAAPGTAAELYLGGVGLARGYHNRPSLTAERFVPDPFSTEGGRLYRTGDLARYRDEGVIEYAGRIDHQVKIRGLRIELGEIEARLLEYPAVREASVIDIDGPSGKQLAAYLVAQDSGELKDALKAHLKAHLPEFMVPSHFVLLEKMPLSANGKLDRRALP
ncbi:non-ribosomal peptide synthetase, partial [Pseudomonas sp. Irchel 3E13]|uniref:non-ribosomal peptide synthetase n=1 Tax=Pseudomonas sp. Irchel 3E13 TaxID=2008975 RepID=UPI000BA4C279